MEEKGIRGYTDKFETNVFVIQVYIECILENRTTRLAIHITHK